MKEKIQKIFNRCGLQVKLKKNCGKESFLGVLIEGLLFEEEMINIVQVGANDGKINDPLYTFLMKYKTKTKALLIEPQKEIIPYLEQNYKDHPSVFIFNGAIGEGKELYLFRIKPELWDSFFPPYLENVPRYRVASGITSSKKEHVLSAVKTSLKVNLPIENSVERIKVSSTNLKSLLMKKPFDQLSEVHVIQVDTEGADDKVLYSCNIDKVKPLIINYEFNHLGARRDQALEEYLEGKGYKIFKWSMSDKVGILVN